MDLKGNTTSVLISTTQGFELVPFILFFGFLSGCGIATFSVGIGQTSYWFPQKKQGNALGLSALSNY